jgi:hypothetical protein
VSSSLQHSGRRKAHLLNALAMGSRVYDEPGEVLEVGLGLDVESFNWPYLRFPSTGCGSSETSLKKVRLGVEEGAKARLDGDSDCTPVEPERSEI